MLVLALIASVFGDGGGAETQSSVIENENYGDLTTGTETSIENLGEYIETVSYSIKHSGLDFENIFDGAL